jgi:hypothetical protein
MVSADAAQESDIGDAKETRIEGFIFSGEDRLYHDQEPLETLKPIGILGDAAFAKNRHRY